MENLSEKIQNYIDGHLEGNDLIQFEAQLAVDIDLRNMLALQKEVQEILNKRVVNKEMELRSTISSVSNNFRHDPNVKVINFKKIVTILAAAAVLIIGSLFVFNGSNELYEMPLMQSEIVRGQEENISYENTVKAFNNRNYAEARVQLESLLKDTPDEIQYAYYLGLTYLGEDNWKLAINKLDPVASGQSVFADEAKYYLAIAYFKNDQPKVAKELLNSLVADDALGKKAKKLLEEIK